MEFKDRLKLARKRARMNQAQLAEAVGLTQTTISDLERGKSRKTGHAVEMAHALGVDPRWLATGNGEMGTAHNTVIEQRPGEYQVNVELDHEVEFFSGMEEWDDSTPLGDDEVELPLFREVELSAGSGQTQVIEINGPKLRFARRTLRRAGVMVENAACAYVNGDSMEPVLMDGTTVGMNTADKVIKDGKMYVIDNEGLLRVKMLYRLPGGGLRVRSYNRDEYPDEDYGPDWPEVIEIKGRVFWSSTMW